MFSDFTENAEKRFNFSKFVDLNLNFIMIIAEIYWFSTEFSITTNLLVNLLN